MNLTARFFTLNHATAITGIAEEEIVAAGERGEFDYNVYTKLIMSPGDFMAWVERRHLKDRAELLSGINERFVGLYVKMAYLQRGLGQVEKTLRELVQKTTEKMEGERRH